MMKPDAAMNLIMQPDFFVGLIFIATDLNSIHSKVGMDVARSIRMFRIHFRQGHECSAIFRPALQLRQLLKSRPAFHHWTTAASCTAHGDQCSQGCGNVPRVFQQPRGILFELNKRLHAFHRIAKNKPRAFERSKEIADHREATARDVLKQNRRAATFTDSAMNLSRFQIRTHFALQTNELPVTFQITNAFLKVAVTHEDRLRRH